LVSRCARKNKLEPAMTDSFLIELLTEELPPKALKRLGESFAESIADRLTKDGLTTASTKVSGFASPRRLAVQMTNVLDRAPDSPKKEKLLPLNIALDANGQPTPPLIKKLSSLGVTLGQDLQVSDLERVDDGKQVQLVYQFTAKGRSLAESAQTALEEAIARLPIPKVMSYQRANGDTVKFVRPAHGLCALHGDRVVNVTALGLTSGRSTLGHRFHAKAPITISHADHYASELETKGKVLASFEKRRQKIVAALTAQAAPDLPVMPDSLLDEVTSLVEWPVVLQAEFEAAFLSVPQECLILTMQQNQKYFALTDAKGALINRFLLVSNIESKDPSVVTSGNARVLRARLSDAKFFFDQDRKKTLASRLDGLSAVVYHNKIGHQRQRVERLATLATQWAQSVGADPSLAQRAAHLAKADLLTDMVGEFPELQGVIGTYYARHDKEPEAVALAIEGHYHPRFSGDSLPANPEGTALALADKMETLVGIWGIGLAPTGDKDPFALRRHALGVIRMLIEQRLPLGLDDLLQQTAASFKEVPAVNPDLGAILAFMLDRLRAWLKEKGYSSEEVESVLAQLPTPLYQVLPRLEAVRQFMGEPEAAALCAANKRIGNILKKSDGAATVLDAKALVEPAEKTLAETLALIAPKAEQAFIAQDYTSALRQLAALRAPVDAFFESVMVNAEDPVLRANRLALLAALSRAMNQVADISRLAA
jgi:glycyl-tRNA synthetase beta chain